MPRSNPRAIFLLFPRALCERTDCGELWQLLLCLALQGPDCGERQAIPTTAVEHRGRSRARLVAAAHIAAQGADEPIRTARDHWNRAVKSATPLGGNRIIDGRGLGIEIRQD